MRSISTLTLLALVLPVAACEDGIGLDGRGTARVTLAQSSMQSAMVTTDQIMSDAGMASVELELVESIKLQITGVDLLPAGEDDEAAGGWVTLSVTGGGSAEFDLLAVPDETQAGIELARGEVEAGSYSNLRIRFSDATITFNQPVTVGPASFDADTEYDLFIPSGAQTGIKTDIAFVVEEDATDTVLLIFDGAQSTASITATGSGSVIMAPVWRSSVEE
ncbi:MAG: DUF4382 domain-containing protein [Longimicrobiales bacterium]